MGAEQPNKALYFQTELSQSLPRFREVTHQKNSHGVQLFPRFLHDILPALRGGESYKEDDI
ncbi:hypothetical protein A3E13_01760 [Candidatus Woesebacteria bacterium RIFCSPHIGHO2_12_FULL_40_20]|nr:MAG: hypothetical protein A3E13_01760 [Candidatus Woesebacteria bacterium RIFCSPHIGHO2_12_FULL_40_20]